MPERYSSVEVVKVLEALGFLFRSQKGSHGKYKNTEGRIVVVPMNRRVLPAGTFKSIINQAGISAETFKELLKRYHSRS